MNKKELTISDKLDIIAMQPMTRETMKFICEIDKEVNLKNYKLKKYKEVLDKIKEYIKENTRYYDKELGLVEMMGARETRTPVVYLYGLLELLEEIE